MTQAQPKVAVIGASGIGKNHARWFHLHSSDVVAFVGSSPESVAKTHQVLVDGFGFTGRGYHDLQTMLDAEKPDIVCVSSPPPLHHEQTLACLEAKAHVLCEKPLVYDVAKSSQLLIDEAEEMVTCATDRNLLLGTQMQYVVAVQKILELSGHRPDGSDVRRFKMEMETKNLKHGRSHELIWIDLSPHPLSVLQKVADACDIAPDSIACEVREHETAAKFRLDPCNVEAEIVVRFNPNTATPLRRFTIDDTIIDYVGRKDPDGEFRTYLKKDGEEHQLPDFVDTLIGNFVAAWRGDEKLIVTGAMGAQNVRWQWQLLEAGYRV